jgi:hypothetical protein
MQDPEKHQELVRSVFQCTLVSLSRSFHHLYSVLELTPLLAVLSARPEGVSNFVQTDAIFGPVIHPLRLAIPV